MHGGWGEDGGGDLWRQQQRQHLSVAFEDIQDAESEWSGGEASATTDPMASGTSPSSGDRHRSPTATYWQQDPTISSLAQLLDVIRLADQFQADHVMKVEETSFPLAPHNPYCNPFHIVTPTQAATSALLDHRCHWTWEVVCGVLDLPPAPLLGSECLAPLLKAARDEVWSEFEDLEAAWRSKVWSVDGGGLEEKGVE